MHDAVTQSEAHGLIIIAPPRALGVLREMYSPTVAKAVRQELHKDLVRAPIHEIEQMLGAQA